MKIDDNYIMPIGKYKGEKLVNVPASYLLWIRDNLKLGKEGPLAEYILENEELLIQEQENEK